MTAPLGRHRVSTDGRVLLGIRPDGDPQVGFSRVLSAMLVFRFVLLVAAIIGSLVAGGISATDDSSTRWNAPVACDEAQVLVESVQAVHLAQTGAYAESIAELEAAHPSFEAPAGVTTGPSGIALPVPGGPCHNPTPQASRARLDDGALGDVVTAAGLFGGALTLVAWVMFLIWFQRCYSNVDRSFRRYGVAWATLGWFLPVLFVVCILSVLVAMGALSSVYEDFTNDDLPWWFMALIALGVLVAGLIVIFFPKRIANDIHRATFGTPSSGAVQRWYFGWLVGYLVALVLIPIGVILSIVPVLGLLFLLVGALAPTVGYFVSEVGWIRVVGEFSRGQQDVIRKLNRPQVFGAQVGASVTPSSVGGPTGQPPPAPVTAAPAWSPSSVPGGLPGPTPPGTPVPGVVANTPAGPSGSPPNGPVPPAASPDVPAAPIGLPPRPSASPDAPAAPSGWSGAPPGADLVHGGERPGRPSPAGNTDGAEGEVSEGGTPPPATPPESS